MYEDDLIRRIVSGRCFLLIGSGVSTELGYPSWEQLAKSVMSHVFELVPGANRESYARFLGQNKYAELLTQAERDLGSRDALVAYLKAILVSTPGRTSTSYDLLTQWPFAVYLTTNFDDEIRRNLQRHSCFFQVLRNRREDLAQIRHDSINLILKLHSDLDHPDEAIITSIDYHNVKTDGRWSHFAPKLRAIFEMFDLVVIGHSLTDPDLALILEMAQATANPSKPIYMTLADVSEGEIREYYEKYNIRIIPYTTTDGSHSELQRLLRTLGYFVPQREYVRTYTSSLDESKVEAATSLFLFRTTSELTQKEGADDILTPLVLKALATATCPLAVTGILALKPLSLLVFSPALQDAVVSLLPKLVGIGFASERTPGSFVITDLGRVKVTDMAAQRQTEEANALGQFRLDLKAACLSFTDEQLSQATRAFRNAMITMLAQRGLDLANVVIAAQRLPPSSLPNLFAALSSEASQFTEPDQQLAFIASGKKFLVEPSTPQRKYLTSLSQGFFLYHLAGLDPTCANLRSDIFRETAWFLDAK